MGPLTVVHLKRDAARDDHSNGLDAAMFALARLERQAGHTTHCVSVDSGGRRRVKEAFGVPVICTSWWRLDALLTELGADIAHVHGTFAPTVNLAALSLHVPYVISPQGAMHAAAFDRKRVRKEIFWGLLDRRLFARAAAAHALSPMEAAAISARSPRLTVGVIPNPLLDPSSARPISASERAAARSALGLGDDEVSIVFIGRLATYHKGLDLLVEAFQGLPAGTPARLVLAGPTVPETEPGSLGLGHPRIVHPGPVFGPSKRELLAAADVFVHSSRHEGMPSACLEALGCGLPLITTAVCGLDQFTAHHRAGWIVEPDPLSIRAGLMAAIDRGPRSASPAISAAAAHAFSPSHVADSMLELYTSLLPGAPSRL